MTEPMMGECGQHPGNSMINCPQCSLERVANTPRFVCNGVFCSNTVLISGTYCEGCAKEWTEQFTTEPEGENGLSVYEYVDHPKHYNDHPAGIECIDVIEHLPFNIGSAIKYLWRVGLKPGEDPFKEMNKAVWYIEREKERMIKLEGKKK